MEPEVLPRENEFPIQKYRMVYPIFGVEQKVKAYDLSGKQVGEFEKNEDLRKIFAGRPRIFVKGYIDIAGGFQLVKIL